MCCEHHLPLTRITSLFSIVQEMTNRQGKCS